MSHSILDTSPTHDLGTLRRTREKVASEVVLVAPSWFTRAVWLFGGSGCLVFLWSVALSLGWLEASAARVTPLRAPLVAELFFWLLPLLLSLLCFAMAAGGVRVTLFDEGLELRGLWPSRERSVYVWSKLRHARFWEETTRSRERLFVSRFSFEGAEVVFRTADEGVWEGLRERFRARI